MEEIRYDCCVIGAGSGGIGAALAAARAGLSVVIVERGAQVGGNAVLGGVHNWEPGVGGDVFPREIYERLALNGAAAIWSFGRHCCWPGGEDYPGGESVIDPGRSYADTQQRHGSRGLNLDEAFCRETWHGIIFEPDAYSAVIEQTLAETQRCTLLKAWSFIDVETKSGAIAAITVKSESGELRRICAPYFVDSTADGRLCRAAGCEAMRGEDSRAEFGESGAPETANPDSVNAVSLIYRVSPTESPIIDMLGDGYASCPWQSTWPMAQIGHYPNADLNINMLPTMNGAEFLRIISLPDGYLTAYDECRRRVRGHWHWMQSNYPEFQRFRLSWIAPTLGVRETTRIRSEYVLTQDDVQNGLSRQKHDDIIALADHAMDIHGERDQGIKELSEPYGIPFRCLLPRGLSNVAVACRGAGFSHIAGSSCRLTRTMMDLGHAAGTAIAIAARNNTTLRDVDADILKTALRRDGSLI